MLRPSRRQALAAVLARLTARPAFAGARPLGLILKMREALDADWAGALKRIAAIGYKELEFPGHLGPSARACRQTLDALGLVALAGGAIYKDLIANFAQVIEDSHALGKRYVCCYWPWLDGGTHKSVDDWKRLGATMNTLGARFKAAGLTLAYHNHDMEFRRIGDGGPMPYDVLLQATDPALVAMELDLWWIGKAEVDPVGFLDRHPGRFAILHIKEPRNTPDTGMACNGDSFERMPQILAAAGRAGTRHFVVENEDPKDHFACADRTYRYLRALKLPP